MNKIYILKEKAESIHGEEVVLAHFGVKGMKWGVRKERTSSFRKQTTDYKTEGFTIKKGTELHRMSTVKDEINKGSGYASFLKEDAAAYRKTAEIFSKVGMNQYDMTLVAKKDLISPSQKERVDVFLKKMEDPKFAKEFRKTRARMFLLNMPGVNDIKLAMNNDNLSLGKAKAYTMLNLAISGNKSLRKQYLDEFRKLHYDFILDETDATNKQATAPIIFLERSKSLGVMDVEEI